MNARPDTTDAAESAVGTSRKASEPKEPCDLDRAVEAVDRWANYEFTTADQIAVRSECSTFTAGDLRLVLSALRQAREAAQRTVAGIEEAFPEVRGLSDLRATDLLGEGLGWALAASRAALTQPNTGG